MEAAGSWLEGVITYVRVYIFLNPTNPGSDGIPPVLLQQERKEHIGPLLCRIYEAKLALR